MGVSVGRECDICGTDNWYGIDNPNTYCEICETCFNEHKTFTSHEFSKQKPIDDFECPECGGLSGHAEENKRKFGVRCDNCGKLFIQFEKIEGAMDNRHINDNIPTCPHCHSKNIQRISTSARLVSASLFGLGSSKVGKTMECKNCGYKW